MIGEIQEAFTKAVEQARDSTVGVSVASGAYAPPYWRGPRRGFGSGVVFDADGHILTSRHAVDGAERILVTRGDGQVFAGRVVGSDEDTDLAVVKVDTNELKPAKMGNSDALKVGQLVLAIGNPLGMPGGPTVTMGVVSSLQRSLQLGGGDGLRMIQTDAAVNPGNSGGPLIDLDGRAVGINTATIPYAEGISFAVPINVAKDIAQQIVAHGRVQRPWLGIVAYDVNRRVANYYGLTASRGVFVVEVSPKGPAEAAGLQVGDVLLGLGGRALSASSDLVDALRGRAVGDAVEIEVDRRGRKEILRATLGLRP